MTAPPTAPNGSPTDARHTRPPRPPLWWRTSLRTGAAIQLLATAAGAALVAVATGSIGGPMPGRSVALVAGLLLIYLDTHAIAHVVVGRMVGIDFRGFGVRGTDHPEDYPVGLRQVMSAVPMWTALTDPVSRRAARPTAQAAMYAAGETSTTICTVAAAGAAFAGGAPLGLGALIVAATWTALASVVVAFVDRGDYRKAIVALRQHPGR